MTVIYHPNARREEEAPKTSFAIVALIVLAIALWIRVPHIGKGMPFFYHEDEAHHWNRTVSMVKTGNLDPQYFHKPSLHFYARIPVVAASFLWTVRNGHIRSIQEVETKDPFGLAGYAFAASHPGMVKWNRAFSVLLSIGAILLAMLILHRLTGSTFASACAGLAAAVSPDLASGSAVIGVDVLMTFTCLLCVWASLVAFSGFNFTRLFWCSLAAGLAVSSKYNALPIVIVPLAVVLFSAPRQLQAWALAVTGMAAGFFIGTPYAISSLPLFLDQMAYEIWHYGVAIRTGNTAEPGWPQALFYLQWMGGSALGPVLLILALFGLASVVAAPRKDRVLVFLFPVVFALLMISQRTNFTRNMHVILPFMGIFALIAYLQIVQWLKVQGTTRAVVHGVFIIAALWFPAYETLKERSRAKTVEESRTLLMEELKGETAPQETAVAGQLELPGPLFAQGSLTRFDQGDGVVRQYLLGFDRVIITSEPGIPPSEEAALEIEKVLPGEQGSQRIIQNPEIRIAKFRSEAARKLALEMLEKDGTIIDCRTGEQCTPLKPDESHAWSQARFAKVLLPPSATGHYQFELMSPWADQTVTLLNGESPRSFTLPAGTWISEKAVLPKGTADLILEAAIVRSPKKAGMSEDSRRLAVAVKRIAPVN